MPRLVFRSGGRAPFELTKAITIGRLPTDCDLAIADKQLSRQHCRIEPFADDSWGLVDLDSANGTLVNGRKVSQTPLRAGDIITLGSVELMFEEVGPGADTVMQGVHTVYGGAVVDDELAEAARAALKQPRQQRPGTRQTVKPSSVPPDVKLKSEPIPAEVEPSSDLVPDTGEVEKVLQDSARRPAVRAQPTTDMPLPADPDVEEKITRTIVRNERNSKLLVLLLVLTVVALVLVGFLIVSLRK